MPHYDRELLYDEVWKDPVSTVAKKYGVSDTALAKACRRLNVPLPPRGYWARVRSGISVKKPKLPAEHQNKTSESTKKSKPAKKSNRIEKSPMEASKDRLARKISAFMRGHMLEKEDIIHHFKYLIACVSSENYKDYSDEYKKRRTLFLQNCIKRIKATHLPALLDPWVFYDCVESTRGFALSVCKTEKMDIKDNHAGMEESTELFSLMEMLYDLITIADFAKLHAVSEKQVREWLDKGKLSGAIYQDGNWVIPELHKKPYDTEYMTWINLEDYSVEIPNYPLISSCSQLHITPIGSKYLLEYYVKGKEWKCKEYITKKEKDTLLGELLKRGITYDDYAYEIANYPAKKHFQVNVDHWCDIPSCKPIIGFAAY